MYVSGSNSFGELCLGNFASITTFTQVPDLQNVSQVAAGQNFVLFLLNNGSVFSCGRNDYGQLGIGSTALNSSTLVQINALSNITLIRAGPQTAGALSNSEVLYTWGSGSSCGSGHCVTYNASQPLTGTVTDMYLGNGFIYIQGYTIKLNSPPFNN